MMRSACHGYNVGGMRHRTDLVRELIRRQEGVPPDSHQAALETSPGLAATYCLLRGHHPLYQHYRPIMERAGAHGLSVLPPDAADSGTTLAC